MGQADAVMIPEPDGQAYAERIADLSVGGAALDLREPRPLKLTVDDLVLLDRHWQDDDHKSTELIDGRIYTTPVRYIPRATVAQEIWFRLREAAAVSAPHLWVGLRGSVEISRFDLPLPDIVVTSEPAGKRFIPAASVPLIIEVVDAALSFYMGEKLRLYARGSISEYWVADVSGRLVHQFWQPHGTTYQRSCMAPIDGRLVSATIPGLEVSLISVM